MNKAIIRHFFILLFCCCSLSLIAQDNNLSVNFSRVPLKRALNELHTKSGYDFLYNSKLIDDNRRVSVKKSDATLNAILDAMLTGTNIQYSIEDKQVVLFLSNPSEVNGSQEKNAQTAQPGSAQKTLSPASAANQSGNTVRGSVLDEAGLPLPGALVYPKSTPKNIVATNADGKFELSNTAANAILIVSFMGYETLEYPLNGRTLIELSLKPNVIKLEDAIVTGYSVKKTGEITGSVQKITAQDLSNTVSSPDITNLLKGKTTGFYVTETADGVRSQSSIVIRGQSTISGEIGPTAPLVVLDGVIMGNIDIMGLVNSNDVESVTLLKDAASTAIYGSRAALGVIVINTYKGKPLGSEQISVNVNARAGVVSQTNLMPLTNTSQWIAQTDRYLSNMWEESNSYQTTYPNKSDFIKAMQIFSPEEAGQYYNWQKEVFGNPGNFNDINLSFRAGTQKVSLYGGAGWYRESGVRLGDKLNRMNFKLNTDIKAASWVSAGFHTSVVVDNSAIQTALPMNGLSYLPFLSPKDQNGNWNKALPYRAYMYGLVPGMLATGDIPNTMYENEAFDNTSERNTINAVGTFNLKLTPIKGLTVQTNNSIIYNSVYLNSNYDANSQSGKYGAISSEFGFAPFLAGYAPMNGALSILNSSSYTFLTSNTAQYTTSFDKHAITALVGQEYSKTALKSAQTDYYDILPGERNPAAAKYFGDDSSALLGADYTPRGFQEESALFSVFGQIDYNYDQRYVLTGSIRTDASPCFGQNKRYGTFYSISGAWQLQREAFMQNAKFVDHLKLRYAYGTSGRNLGGVFLNKSFYSNSQSYNGEVNSGSIISQLGNPDIGWETTYNHTAGIDFGFFNRLSGSVDVYHKRSADLIQVVSLPATQGGFSQQQNIGELVNKGVEIMLEADVVKTRNFKWHLSANYSRNKNEITKLAKDSLSVYNGRYFSYIGESLETLKAIPYMGVNPENGAPLFEIYNANGEKVIVEGFQGRTNIRNFQPIGSNVAKYYGGIQSTWSYKNLTLSTDWYFSVGRMIDNQEILSYIPPSGALEGGNNLPGIPSSIHIWSGPGDTGANMPNFYSTKYGATDVNGNPGWDLFYATFGYSSMPYQDGSYLRLRNVKLSYNLPENFARKCYMQNALVYLSLDNVFVLTKSGFWLKDPDGAFKVVNPFRVIFGLNINF